jgi:hypothetical protein
MRVFCLFLQTVITKVKTYHKVLQSFVTNAKLELTLLVTLQVCCYMICNQSGFLGGGVA